MTKRGTFNQLFRLSHYIKISILQRKVTTGIFLDAERAFDNTWHNGLKYKLNLSNLNINYIRLISSFLTNRKMQVYFKGKYSELCTLQAGTPQGSVLSPLLYILYVNDLPANRIKYCNISQFADDTAF